MQMSDMNERIEICRELSKHIDIMQQSFNQNNLDVLDAVCRSSAPGLIVNVEVCAIEGASIPNDIKIKVDIYDSEGLVLDSGTSPFRKRRFDGYDTVKFIFLQG